MAGAYYTRPQYTQNTVGPSGDMMTTDAKARTVIEKLIHAGVMRCKYGNLTLTEAVSEVMTEPLAGLIEAAERSVTLLSQQPQLELREHKTRQFLADALKAVYEAAGEGKKLEAK